MPAPQQHRARRGAAAAAALALLLGVGLVVSASAAAADAAPPAAPLRIGLRRASPPATTANGDDEGVVPLLNFMDAQVRVHAMTSIQRPSPSPHAPTPPRPHPQKKLTHKKPTAPKNPPQQQTVLRPHLLRNPATTLQRHL
jgi:hypothetical protein